MPLDMQSELEDEALLALYAQGDAKAARVLTARFTPRMFSLALRMLNDRTEAEDVTQEAMLRLWKMAPKWQTGQAQVSTWLYRVCSNLCTDRLRKKPGLALDDVQEPQDPAPSAEAKLQTQARMEALQEGLAALPERQRQAVVLRHIEGLKNPQIAQILQISTEAVESLTARGKRALVGLLSHKRDMLGYSDDEL